MAGNWTDKQIQAVMENRIPEGKTYAQCSHYCRYHLHRGFSPIRRRSRDDRAARMFKMHESGMTYQAIADKEGITRQRVHSLIQQWQKSLEG